MLLVPTIPGTNAAIIASKMPLVSNNANIHCHSALLVFTAMLVNAGKNMLMVLSPAMIDAWIIVFFASEDVGDQASWSSAWHGVE